jgi:hypothetical protein
MSEERLCSNCGRQLESREARLYVDVLKAIDQMPHDAIPALLKLLDALIEVLGKKGGRTRHA